MNPARILMRTGILALCALVCIGAGIELFLRSTAGENAIRRILVSSIGDTPGIGIALDSLDGRGLRGMDVYGLRVYISADTSTRVTVDTGRIFLSPLALFSYRIRISEFRMRGIHLDVSKNDIRTLQKDISNTVDGGNGYSWLPLPRISVDTFSLEPIQLRYRDSASGVHIGWSEAVCRGAIASLGRMRGFVRIPEAAVVVDNTAKITIDTIFAHGRYDEGFFYVSPLYCRTDAGTIQLHVDTHPPKKEVYTARVQLEPVRSRITELVTLPAQVRIPESINAEIAITRPLQPLPRRIDAMLRSTGAGYERVNVDSMRLHAVFADRHLDASLRVMDESIDARVWGRARLHESAGSDTPVVYTAQCSCRVRGQPDVMRQITALPALAKGASVHAQLFTRGPLKPAVPESVCVGMQVFAPNARTDAVINADARKNKQGKWRLDAQMRDAAMVNAEGHIGAIDAVQGEAVVHLKPSAASVLGINGVRGRGGAASRIVFDTGPDMVQVSGTMTAGGVGYRGLDLDTLYAGFEKKAAGFFWRTGYAEVSGLFDSVLTRMAGLEDYAAEGSLDVEFHGPVTEPDVRGRLRTRNTTIAGIALDSLATRLDYRDRRLLLQGLYAQRDSVFLRGRGRIDFGDTLRIKSRAGVATTATAGDCTHVSYNAKFYRDFMNMDLALDDIYAGTYSSLIPKRIHVGGYADASLSIYGDIARPHTRLWLRAQKVYLNRRRVFDTLTLNALVDTSILRGTLSGSYQQGLVTIDAVLPLSEEAALKADTLVQLSVEKMDLEPLSCCIESTLTVWGTASCNARIRGLRDIYLPDGGFRIMDAGCAVNQDDTLFQRIHLTAQSLLNATHADSNTFILASDAPIRTSYGSIDTLLVRAMLADSFVHIDTLLGSVGKGSIAASATIPLIDTSHNILHSEYFSLDYAVSAIPLGLVQPFLGSFAVVDSGVVHARGSIRSRAGNRHTDIPVKGRIGVRNARFTLQGVDPGIGPLRMGAFYNADTLVLDTFDFVWGTGRIRAHGGAGWSLQQGLRNAGFNVVAEDVRLKSEPVFSGGIDTMSVFVEAKTDSAVTVHGMMRTAPSQLDYTIARPVPDAGLILGGASDNLDKIDVNIRVVIPDSFDVHVVPVGLLEYAGEIRTRLGGVLEIRGTPAKPFIEGNIRGDRGTLRYLDKEFSITRLSMIAAGSDINDTRIRVGARTSIRSGSAQRPYEIRLRLEGTLRQLQATLESTPPLSEPEIVSMIMTGSPDVLSGGGRGMAGTSRTTARRLIGSRMSAYTEKNISQLFDLEEVSISDNVLQSISSGEDVSVSFQKQLTERLRLEYYGEIGSDDAHRSVITWKMLPHLYFSAERDARGNTGVDFKLKLQE